MRSIAPRTIFLYQGEVRRFKEFCWEKGITDYTSEIGKNYADDVISPITGKYSAARHFLHGRLTTSGFYAFATLEMMSEAMNKAAPAFTDDEKLWKKPALKKLLYSLD